MDVVFTLALVNVVWCPATHRVVGALAMLGIGVVFYIAGRTLGPKAARLATRFGPPAQLRSDLLLTGGPIFVAAGLVDLIVAAVT